MYFSCYTVETLHSVNEQQHSGGPLAVLVVEGEVGQKVKQATPQAVPSPKTPKVTPGRKRKMMMDKSDGKNTLDNTTKRKRKGGGGVVIDEGKSNNN
ncbi:hypothetical protein Pmani_000300 [Petrolisthes manimaculis]|uniref:Uncharacterized protein n=1 Tax=Petrolisthes manimaculis TaxID=1843537 RepID=A0AAE1QN04_9EUCA|nr:hypothetical protein Pmani_000300 [Petrolisthes manimaculis]